MGQNDDKNSLSHRIPPGQRLTRKWPVLHVGHPPEFDPQTWTFDTRGCVENPLSLSWDDFNALPKVDIKADMHCVTTWSQLDMTWTGVHIRELLAMTQPTAAARFVIAHCDGGYTTNIPIETLDDDDVLLATAESGKALSLDHGFPMRLVVPKRYAWKSAKWLRALEFSETDQPGFWEVRGYHNEADPFKEERFG